MQEAGRVRGAGAGTRNREAFLAAIDGMMYGDDPRQGVIEGREFLHPEMRIAFTIPQGFTMQNGASAVTITGPNTQAQLRTARYNGNLEAYVGAALQDLAGNQGQVGQVPVQRTTVNGIPAAYTQIRANSGQTQVDVTVFAYAPTQNQAYHFVVLTPAGRGVGAIDSMLQSFRTLSAREAAAVRPRFVRVVTVGPRDTVQSLAGRMAFPSYQAERFLVLNGMDGNARLTAGQRVKIVTY
jgi:predicted Zn-dependent protease